jgi:hypothetical protein
MLAQIAHGAEGELQYWDRRKKSNGNGIRLCNLLEYCPTSGAINRAM